MKFKMIATIQIKADSSGDLRSVIDLIEKSDLPVSIQFIEIRIESPTQNSLTPDQILALLNDSNNHSAS